MDTPASFDARLFRALAAPTRVDLVEALMRAGGSANVTALADAVPVDTSVVSRHLRELAAAGVVEVERRGRERWYHLRTETLIASFSTMIAHLRTVQEGSPCC